MVEGDLKAAQVEEGTPNRCCTSPVRDSLLILIVDDDEDLRVFAREVLVRPGTGLWRHPARLRDSNCVKNPPDLLMLDLNMPDVDGFEFLRRLRADEAGQLIPVIVLTAHNQEESVRISFELGATDFLTKPFTPPQLDARVRSCFAHSSYQE